MRCEGDPARMQVRQCPVATHLLAGLLQLAEELPRILQQVRTEILHRVEDPAQCIPALKIRLALVTIINSQVPYT